MIINRCNFSMIFKFCINDNSSLQILRFNHMYRKLYKINLDDDEIVIKLVSNQTIQNAVNIINVFNHNIIIQLEYIYKFDIKIWYDISNVNDNNFSFFTRYELSLNSLNFNCKDVICFANRNYTTEYILSKNNYAIHNCKNHQNLHLQLYWIENINRIIIKTFYSSCNCI